MSVAGMMNMLTGKAFFTGPVILITAGILSPGARCGRLVVSKGCADAVNTENNAARKHVSNLVIVSCLRDELLLVQTISKQ